MNYKLIMLPQPILVSDEEIKEGDWYLCWETVDGKPTNFITSKATNTESVDMYSWASNYFKVLAGIEGLPKLDLSLIAEEIGWVDVEKLDMRFVLDGQDIYTAFLTDSASSAALGGFLRGCRHGFTTAQSLNEKKWTDDDMIDFHNFIFRHPNQNLKMGEYLEEFKRSRKPKVYNVELEMQDKIAIDGHTVIGKEPTITNNTIKVTKLL